MKKIFYMLVMIAITNLANAECSTDACLGVYVDRLYVTNVGTVYIGTSGDENLLNCNATSEVYTTLNMNDPGASAIYSTLLSAQMASKKVNVRIYTGSAGCSVQYVTLDRQ